MLLQQSDKIDYAAFNLHLFLGLADLTKYFSLCDPLTKDKVSDSSVTLWQEHIYCGGMLHHNHGLGSQ